MQLIIHVLDGCWCQYRQVLCGEKSYAAPMRKRPARASLCRIEVCNFHIIGNGHIKITKSVKIQGRGPMILKTYLLPQLLGTVGSQLDLTG